MPFSQELFHFAFCYLFIMAIVIYIQEKNGSAFTKIYCPGPTDDRIFYSERIMCQSFVEYPNQILFYQLLNEQEDLDASYMNYDVLVPEIFEFEINMNDRCAKKKNKEAAMGHLPKQPPTGDSSPPNHHPPNSDLKQNFCKKEERQSAQFQNIF